MAKLEVCGNIEWLTVFSPVDFSGVGEYFQAEAAGYFANDLISRLSGAGFDVEYAGGQRSTCHGWNGANTFQHLIGPVGTFDKLTAEEIETLRRCISEAEADMQREWND